MSDVRVYVAAPLSEVETARGLASYLEDAGFSVCSRWHDRVEAGDVDPAAHASRASILATNLGDVARADHVLAYVATGVPRCTWVEVGYAIAMGKRVTLVTGPIGEGSCLVDGHPSVTGITRTDDPATEIRRAHAEDVD